MFPEKKPRKRKATGETNAQNAANEAVEKISTIAESPGHAKSTGWSTEDIDTITAGAALLLLEFTRFLSNRLVQSDTLMMNEDESEVMAKAASRIILRHIKVSKGKRGDVTDGTMLLVATIAYGMRTFDGYSRIRSEANKANNASASNGRSDQAIRSNQPGISVTH